MISFSASELYVGSSYLRLSIEFEKNGIGYGEKIN